MLVFLVSGGNPEILGDSAPSKCSWSSFTDIWFNSYCTVTFIFISASVILCDLGSTGALSKGSCWWWSSLTLRMVTLAGRFTSGGSWLLLLWSKWWICFAVPSISLACLSINSSSAWCLCFCRSCRKRCSLCWVYFFTWSASGSLAILEKLGRISCEESDCKPLDIGGSN